MTRQRWIIVGVVALVLLIGGSWFLMGREATASTPYRLVSVERGDVEETISSTGSVAALQTVAIGTQVSGQVIELHADFNDVVSEGQLLARIDPTLQQQQVRNAEASLERALADLRRNEQEYARNKTLFDQNVITESEFSQIEYQLATSRSSVTSAEINLEQARQNLEYTSIYAPIDGVVIERNAEIGQTVQSSMTTPQLFLLARDLSDLEIHASVDESEIGMIEAQQEVRFTVQAYRGETFRGVVRQVRLQSTSQENVVNYSVVISVDNPDLRLLPGMTATVDFIVRRAEDVFKVSNAALRFTPTPEMLAQVGGELPTPPGRGGPNVQVTGDQPPSPSGQDADGPSTPAGARPPMNGGDARAVAGFPGGVSRVGPAARAPMSFSNLWYLKDDGSLGVMQVRSGVSDGIQTEIQAPDLKEGMQVIAGMNIATPTTGTQTTNPFQQGGGRGGMRFGPGF